MPRGRVEMYAFAKFVKMLRNISILATNYCIPLAQLAVRVDTRPSLSQ